jgi:hypothetical protein
MSTATLLRSCALGLALAASAAAQTSSADRTLQRAFGSGGTVYLDLSAGEYTIAASPDNTIRVVAHATSKHRADETTVRIDISTRGNRADIAVDGPLNDGVKVDIQLPRHTNLVTELTAGELSLKDIEGSKDISARAGELTIEVGNRDRYRNVRASVRVGELKATPFNINKEGLFRSFSWQGKGTDDLSVSLWAGELTLN